MGVLLGQLAAYAAAGALYVFFLRLSSKWTLGFKVSRRLAWIWYGIALVLALANMALASTFPRPASVGAAVGVALHIALGGAFFGKFAVDQSKSSPGFAKGVGVVGIGAALMIAVCAALFFGSTYLLGRLD